MIVLIGSGLSQRSSSLETGIEFITAFEYTQFWSGFLFTNGYLYLCTSSDKPTIA